MTAPYSLYRNAVLLDASDHRHLRVQPLHDYSVAAKLHATWLGVEEFAQAALEYVIMFVDAASDGDGGRAQVAPAALLGVSPGENLMVDGSHWLAHYVPAYIRRYPFSTVADTRDPNTTGVMLDTGWPGLSETEGEPLFESDGAPAVALRNAIDLMRHFEADAQRTREFCARLVQHDLLREMKADATLPDGQIVSVKGFYAIEEAALRSLPSRVVLDLHASGELGMMHAHLLSLGNLRPLIERKAARHPAPAALDPGNPA